MSLFRYVTHFWQLYYTSTPTRLDKSTRTRSFSRGLYSGSNRGLFLSFSITTRTRPSSGPQRSQEGGQRNTLPSRQQHCDVVPRAHKLQLHACTYGRREDDKNHLFQDPTPQYRTAAPPSFLSLGGSARDFGPKGPFTK